MAERAVDYLLVGGGMASANCARWLREEGADGSVLLVGREPDPPYNRPPLSKGVLTGTARVESCTLQPAAGTQVMDLGLPDGSLVISILRDGAGFVPVADSVIEPGDEVLLILDTGLEAKVTERFVPQATAA